MTYGFLMESVWHPPLFAETTEAPLPTLLELQAMWFAGAFGREFETTNGQRVKLVAFGEWNRGSGPDFVHTAVEIDGELRKGALELDSDAGEWEAEGHQVNEEFREVVMHVVFQSAERKDPVRNCDHREIPQVVITEMQLTDAVNRPQREVAIAHPERCIQPLKRMPNSALERLLNEAAVLRADHKAARWLRLADAHGRDQALFQSTAETLGYRGNALQMRLLAQRAPLGELLKAGDSVEAILFGTAGFLVPMMHDLARPDVQDYLRRLWDQWWKIRDQYDVAPERSIHWKTHGQRPANHPHRRIGALVALIKQWPTYRRLAMAAPFHVKPLVDFLKSLDDDFWSHRHTLTSAASSKPVALFGKSQALELVANHLAPLAIHENRMSFQGYYKIRHSAVNDKVRRCGLRMFGSEEAAKPWTRRICHHQALLQVYQDFCLDDHTACEESPFPEQLQQWR